MKKSINQSLIPKIPTLEEQIRFVNNARTKALVLRTSEHVEMFRAIETNLVAVKMQTAKLSKNG